MRMRPNTPITSCRGLNIDLPDPLQLEFVDFLLRQNVPIEVQRQQDDAILAALDAKLAPRIRAFQESERLSDGDHKLRIHYVD